MLSTHSDKKATAARSKHKRPANFDLNHAVEIYGGGGIVCEVVTITPDVAAAWLKANRLNRPVRRKVWEKYSAQMSVGQWELNGQAIIIAENEDILDGQHRLLAVIDSGTSIRTLVVYGVEAKAFATIDTGAARTPADAVYLHFREYPVSIVKAAATAAQWCARLETGNVLSSNSTSNADVIDYVKRHSSILQCAETLAGFQKESRPLSLGVGCALYEMFTRKDAELAGEFMKAVYTGESLTRKDVEYLLRQALLRDTQRASKLPPTAKVRMTVKAWNWRRRKMPDATPNVIALRTDDDQRIKIL